MKNEFSEVADLVNTIEIEEDSDSEQAVQSKTSKGSGGGISEAFGATPLEDRHGRSLWIRTRLCFCPSSNATDCRFHSTSEKGWEQCPSLPAAQKDQKINGRWLWARNPQYGKPLVEEETKEEETA